MENIEKVISLAIRNGIEIGCVQTMKSLGVSSGEMSERKAVRTYGKWFVEAIRKNEITPCRVGNGRTGTRVYNVTDILSYKAMKEIHASIKL